MSDIAWHVCCRRSRPDGLRHRPGGRAGRATTSCCATSPTRRWHAARAASRRRYDAVRRQGHARRRATPRPRSPGSPPPPTWTRPPTPTSWSRRSSRASRSSRRSSARSTGSAGTARCSPPTPRAIPITQIAAVTERPGGGRRHPLLLAGADDGAVRAGPRLQDQRRDAGARPGRSPRRSARPASSSTATSPASSPPG